MKKYKKIALFIMIGITCITSFVVLFIDWMIHSSLSWSLIVVESLFLFDVLVIPLMMKNKKGIGYSLFLMSVLVLPYVHSIVQIFHLDDLVFRIGWKVSLVVLIYAWLFFGSSSDKNENVCCGSDYDVSSSARQSYHSKNHRG